MCYTMRQYDNRVRKLARLEAEKKDIEKQIQELQDEIKNSMGDLEAVETELYKISFPFVTSNRFDTTRFKREQAPLYAAYLKESTTRRFSYAAR